MVKRTIKGVLIMLSVVVSVAGCSRLANRDDATRDTVRVDGNLYAHHFEGGLLNASGRAKIDALPAKGPAVIVIHPTRATDRQVFVMRAKDVKVYAKQRGLTEAQVRFESTYDDEPAANLFDPRETTTACVADDNR